MSINDSARGEITICNLGKICTISRVALLSNTLCALQCFNRGFWIQKIELSLIPKLKQYYSYIMRC